VRLLLPMFSQRRRWMRAIVPILYDLEECATLYHADKDRALACVAAMTEPQRVRQALAYAAWLTYCAIMPMRLSVEPAEVANG
jgi:hypothetical protein